MKIKRLIRFAADTTFNSEIRYDEKNHRWVATRSLTEEEQFLTEEEAKSWIKQRPDSKPEAKVSKPDEPALPDPAKIVDDLEPPGIEAQKAEPKPSMSPGLPVDSDNPKVRLPIASIKKRLISNKF